MRTIVMGEMDFLQVYGASFRSDSYGSGAQYFREKSQDEKKKTNDFADLLDKELKVTKGSF